MATVRPVNGYFISDEELAKLKQACARNDKTLAELEQQLHELSMYARAQGGLGSPSESYREALAHINVALNQLRVIANIARGQDPYVAIAEEVK